MADKKELVTVRTKRDITQALDIAKQLRKYLEGSDFDMTDLDKQIELLDGMDARTGHREKSKNIERSKRSRP